MELKLNDKSPSSREALIARLTRGSRRAENGCLLWCEGLNDRGYGVVNIGRKQHKVHRLTWQVEEGPIPDGLFVCHKCDVRACREMNHLCLGTQADNLADMTAKGRRSAGERSGSNKLSDDAVLAIRAAAETQSAIAARFGITQSQVSRIKRGNSWAHLGAGGVLSQ